MRVTVLRKGEIADIEDLVVVKPWKFVEERGIDVRRHHEVVAVDRGARTVTVESDEARAAGFDPVSATITTISRAHYYPGWSRIVVHATADRETGVLLGANRVGKESVAHRIDSVAAALTVGMTVPEVERLDFGYSPPFGPVWDPVLGVARVLAADVS